MGRRTRHQKDRPKAKQLEAEEIKVLDARVMAEAPPPGTIATKARTFAELPLSKKTMMGLEDSGFSVMTEIQAAAIPHALAGRDVLGAARTGSGKTLAFVIPLLEVLFRQRWSSLDGLGALIVSPVRELALQIFDVLRNVGRHHDLSAGLLIGGNDIREERDVLGAINVLVATPGRLLQHMDNNPNFDGSHLQVLVLDEADRMLDMGFQREMDAIVRNLPRARQTMLYSATLTKNVRALARLSLRSPEYIAVHQEAPTATPQRLQQQYAVVELPRKVDAVWSFVRTHRQQKSVVFLATCKQVRFFFEAFRRLRPGVSLMMLHSHMKQGRRTAVYNAFCDAEKAVLFATDIASRGLDFPQVDWVLQADCPEDVDQYIHRAGRTARYESGGRALLFLLPSELAFVTQLQSRRVPIGKVTLNAERMENITARLQGVLAQEPELKHLGQKAFISYVKMVHVCGNKDVFQPEQLPLAAFAASLGLPGSPVIRFKSNPAKALQTQPAPAPGSAAAAAAADAEETEDESESDEGGPSSDAAGSAAEGASASSAAESASAAASSSDSERSAAPAPPPADKGKPRSRLDKLQARRNQTVLSDAYARLRAPDPAAAAAAGADGAGSGSDDELLRVKRVILPDESGADEADAAQPRVSKRSLRRIKPSGLGVGTRTLFDDEGRPLNPLEKAAADAGAAGDGALDWSAVRQRMKERDAADRQAMRERLKAERLKKKLARKAKAAGAEGGVQLAMPSDDDAGGVSGGDDDSRSGSEVDSASDSSGAPSEEESVAPGSKRKGSIAAAATTTTAVAASASAPTKGKNRARPVSPSDDSSAASSASSDSDGEPEAPVSRPSKRHAAAPTASLVDDEERALAILRSRR